MNVPPVLHRGAKAITAPEFFDALQATCLPRFPSVRGTEPRRVALAMSGGVDSMALAYLCYQFQMRYRFRKLSDNPLHHFQAIIINHDLRDGSLEEANNVVNVLRDRFNMYATVHSAKWADVLAPGQNPKDVPNVETLARQARYRRIGDVCKNSGVASLLTAHHEGDQYETVLMRLLAGHGYRGLQGMRAANDIPECYDIHGSYQSGFHEDQQRTSPYYNLRPTRRDKRKIRASLEVEALEAASDDVSDALKSFGFDYLEYEGIALNKRAPLPVPLECEDGGITMYRPLLEFTKERLIATCLEHGVPWFEDHTNHDPTLTTRNAIRHMYKNYTLPVALQKPSILRLAERCRKRVQREEAEAGRLASHARVLDFEPSVGTVVVEFRPFRLPTAPRRTATSPAARQQRIAHFRHIAAIMIRRLISLVTPERDLSPLAQLNYLVSVLFPSLADASSPRAPSPPKAYVICGVHFTPLIGDHPLRWLLSRAPLVSHMPRPKLMLSQLGLRFRRFHPQKWKKTYWSHWEQYDGRYWARSSTRLPFKVFLAPFELEHQKAFRTALGDDRAKNDLARMLRRYAPAKVRYTLPALYAAAPITELLEGGGWWPSNDELFAGDDAPVEEDVGDETAEIEAVKGVTAEDRAVEGVTAEDGAAVGGMAEDGTAADGALESATAEVAKMGMSYQKRLVARRLRWENGRVKNAKPQLIALPTLGVALPGLSEWVDVEMRYRKVDHTVIRAGAVGHEREQRRKMALEAIRRWPARSRRRVT